jgi:hypothetical protein
VNDFYQIGRLRASNDSLPSVPAPLPQYALASQPTEDESLAVSGRKLGIQSSPGSGHFRPRGPCIARLDRGLPLPGPLTPRELLVLASGHGREGQEASQLFEASKAQVVAEGCRDEGQQQGQGKVDEKGAEARAVE